MGLFYLIDCGIVCRNCVAELTATEDVKSEGVPLARRADAGVQILRPSEVSEWLSEAKPSPRSRRNHSNPTIFDVKLAQIRHSSMLQCLIFKHFLGLSICLRLIPKKI